MQEEEEAPADPAAELSRAQLQADLEEELGRMEREALKSLNLRAVLATLGERWLGPGRLAAGAAVGWGELAGGARCRGARTPWLRGPLANV